MKKYVIHGGRPLYGKVNISGAKNAAVAIIPAALLVEGVCRIENIPQISDVTALLKILEQLGAKVRVLTKSDVEIDCTRINTIHVPQDLTHKIRASYYLIGALLGRFGEADELLGTLLWLTDEKASGFVTGVVVPVDGGFSAYSGV